MKGETACRWTARYESVMGEAVQRMIYLQGSTFIRLQNTFECYNGMFDPNDTPVALKISKRVLTLPLFADLPLSDVDRICDIIKDCAE